MRQYLSVEQSEHKAYKNIGVPLESPLTVEASGFIDLIRSIKNFMYELILLN